MKFIVAFSRWLYSLFSLAFFIASRLSLATGSFILFNSSFDFHNSHSRFLNHCFNSTRSDDVLFSVVLSTSKSILLKGFISVPSFSLLFKSFFSSVSQINAESNACAVKFFSVKRAIRVLIS
jgi:hypothetical protein